MSGLAELEHHVVGGVHHVVDRPHPCQGETAGEPRRGRPDLDPGERPDGESGTELGVVDLERGERLDRRTRRELGEPRHRPEVDARGWQRAVPAAPPRSRATPAMHQASGRLASTATSNTTSRLDAEGVGERLPGRGHPRLREDEQPLVVVREPELPTRTEHAVRPDALHRDLGDRHAAGQDRPDGGEHHQVADREVGSAAHHLGARRAVVHHHFPDPIGTGDRVDASTVTTRSPPRPSPTASHPLDHEPEIVEGGREFDSGRPSKGAKSVSQESGTRTTWPSGPGHQNWPTKRRSFSIRKRMSGIWWRICAQRSMPNPKANPLHSSRVDAHRGEDRGVDHPASAELDPAGHRTGAAPRPTADGAGDLELGRGLGEGEVGRSEPRVDVRPEVRSGEDLDGPGQVREGDAPIDHQAFDLVEDRQMARVGGVPAVATPGHHRVDGQRAVRTAFSIRWTCTGEVWVRSRTVSGSPSPR